MNKKTCEGCKYFEPSSVGNPNFWWCRILELTSTGKTISGHELLSRSSKEIPEWCKYHLEQMMYVGNRGKWGRFLDVVRETLT